MKDTDEQIGGGGKPDPEDALREGERTRSLLASVEGMKGVVEGTRLVSDAVLAHVLFALWDNGFYGYALRHERFTLAQAAEAMGVNARVFEPMVCHLAGHGLVCMEEDTAGLSERGKCVFNALSRGAANLYLGGYGALLGRLSDLLQGHVAAGGPETARSEQHVGLGSEQLACVRIATAVEKLLQQHHAGWILDLGCGTGGFLVQLARRDPTFHGLGVDRSAAAVNRGLEEARRFRVEDRVTFRQLDLGVDPLELGAEGERVNAITALYLFHEFGRHGPEGIVSLLRGLRRSLPGRLLVFAECVPADSRAMAAQPPTVFTQLDYWLIHPLSGQGPPRTEQDWQALVREAGLTLVETQRHEWVRLYAVKT